MDGFVANEGVVVLGATNRSEDLDKALLRPGRFDTQVVVPIPDMKGRREILVLYLVRAFFVNSNCCVLQTSANRGPDSTFVDEANSTRSSP